MIQLVSYNFSTVENPLSDAGNFSTNFGYTAPQAIAGNLCEPSATTTNCLSNWTGKVVQTGDSWPADQYAEVTIHTLTSTTTATAYVSVRNSSSAKTHYLLVLQGTTPAPTAQTQTVFAGVAGVYTSIGTFSATISIGDVWRISVTGTTITISQNGSTVKTITDSTVTSGTPGLGVNSNPILTNAQISLFAAGANQAATPTFSPVAGAYGPAQTVTISSTTPTGTIFYTTDGTTPTHSSSSISNGGTITVSSTQTVNAFVSVTDFADSATGSAAYTINGAVTASTFSPVAGTYSSTQSVTLLNADSALTGFAQYYTTDGSTPTTGSTLYSGPITVSSTQTIKVLAVATGYSNSSVASAAYTISPSSATAVPWFLDQNSLLNDVKHHRGF